MADEGFHEIQLSGKHLVALFMAATVVAVVIFLCGVMVGRDVQKQRVAMAASTAEPLADPTAQIPTSSAPPVTPPGAAAGAAASGQETARPDTASPASRETLSYPDRLAGNTPAPESLKPAPEARAPERSAPTPPPPPPAERSTATPARGEPQGPGFAVQVAAVAERDEAETIARRLSGKGYPAYVMAPAAGAPRMFRVRVGKFKDRREAEQIAARLKREEQFNPWIAR